jgi:hypothetical protein
MNTKKPIQIQSIPVKDVMPPIIEHQFASDDLEIR